MCCQCVGCGAGTLKSWLESVMHAHDSWDVSSVIIEGPENTAVEPEHMGYAMLKYACFYD